MYSRVAAATGWTWEYIGQALTLPRLSAMYAYWRRFPPVAESVAAYLGIKETKPIVKVDNAWQVPLEGMNEETARGVANLPKRFMPMPQGRKDGQ